MSRAIVVTREQLVGKTIQHVEVVTEEHPSLGVVESYVILHLDGGMRLWASEPELYVDEEEL